MDVIKKATITDVEEGTCLTIPQNGAGDYLIGLSSEDKICLINWSDRHKDHTIVVELFKIENREEGKYNLQPIKNDLQCFLNRSPVDSIQPLAKECKIEIGDKVLIFWDGTKKHRKLPPTPGVLILPTAPPKPKRDQDGQITTEQAAQEDDEAGLMTESWQYVPSPGVEFDVTHGVFRTPDQIASVAASHVVRQMMLFTDLKMSVTMMDGLYKAFKEVAENNQDILCHFLTESKKELAIQRRERSSGHVTSQPLHGPVIELLVTLLKHSLEPVSHVILWLLFLRTLSHFTQNFSKLLWCQAAAAIMGSMSVYLEVPEVQQYGLEILCKLATYKPSIQEKAPVRETGVELIIRAMKWHDGSLVILRPACRALANLASTFKDLITQYSDDKATTDSVSKWNELLLYMEKDSVPAVLDVMAAFPRDLGIQTEGRRLLSTLNSSQNNPLRRTSSLGDLESEVTAETEKGHSSDEEDTKPSILKSARSFENLRTPTRKVQFSSETIGGALSNESIFLDSMEASSRFDGSGQFLDSFGNEMDMPDSASYIGQDSDVSNRNAPALRIYKPPISSHKNNSDSQINLNVKSSEKLDDVKSSEGNVEFDKLAAELKENITHHTDTVLTNHITEEDPSGTVNQSSEALPISEPTNEEALQNESPPPLPPRQPINLPPLKTVEPSYSPADVKFLPHLMRTVITGYVCSLVFSGEDSQALQAIDQPIGSLLTSAKASEFLLQYVAIDYQPDKSLMDIDPAMVISIIDAVRYRSLTCDLLKSSLTELIGLLTDQLNYEVSTCAFDSIIAIIEDTSLQSIFKEEKFICQLVKSIPDVKDDYIKLKIEELQTVLTDFC